VYRVDSRIRPLGLFGICICLALATPAVATADEPLAPLVPTDPQKIRSRPRVFGIGWTAGGGFDLGDRPFTDLGSMTFDAGIEARVFPVDRISIDVRFDIAESLYESALIPNRNAYHLHVFFHMHDTHREGPYFAAAPYAGLRTYVAVEDTVAAFDVGSRVGCEIPAHGGTFAMGIYSRPGVQVFKNIQGLTTMSLEVVLEFTWTVYVLGPEIEEE
jgi:hypothetical protein